MSTTTAPVTSITARMANACAARYGFTPAQRDAYAMAVHEAPAAVYLPGGRMAPVDTHAIGMAAARAAGFRGGE